MSVRASVVVAVVLAVLLPATGDAATRRMAVPEIGSPSPVAVLAASGRIHIEAKPRRNEGLLAFAERLCGNSRHASALSRANGGVQRLRRGVRYKVPFELLPARHRQAVIRALLPRDQPTAEGWRHRVASASRGARSESLWSIAEWFTGSGENHRTLRRANNLTSNVIRPGQVILIPRDTLSEPYAGMLPAAATRQVVTAADSGAGSFSADGPFVRYASDAQGDYASYRLRAGEALYSSVVMRFTGRLLAADVNELVDQIRERNAIRDVRDLPVGYEVKIPLDLLSARYLPPDHPQRQEWEAQRSASEQIENELLALDLDGVTVVLDAGHGGRDTGAPVGGIWESAYVYDIMLRTKRILESRTAAAVVPTTRDGATFRIQNSDVLPHSRGHAVLTNPPYRIDNAAVATNFRWYLSNSIYRQSRQAGAEPSQVIFISIHADSLHPSLNGAMVYIPGLVGITNNYGKSGRVYNTRREVRAEPRVSFTRTERTTSKGLSRDLAEHLLDSFRRADLSVHHNNPIRDRIWRGRRVYVPAQLRFNRIPAKVLLEVCNLSNDQDRRLIKTRAYRQRVAEAIVNGVLSYYGVPGAGAERSVTAGS
ncbi:MAG: LysM peptidoglycan-binding domain-containing protein [Holophagales bacterium]|nr:LysM peptidoglycan-binding domain-containing protein [Holophagales bacterium]MYD21279.1 LysM peptidoglycan-binding domain-containing protein [Holophagales bacterium]MYI32533.1 LysM peptidoglycan-binding domain-containing protein [Holophagales bacterium]